MSSYSDALNKTNDTQISETLLGYYKNRLLFNQIDLSFLLLVLSDKIKQKCFEKTVSEKYFVSKINYLNNHSQPYKT